MDKNTYYETVKNMAIENVLNKKIVRRFSLLVHAF